MVEALGLERRTLRARLLGGESRPAVSPPLRRAHPRRRVACDARQRRAHARTVAAGIVVGVRPRAVVDARREVRGVGAVRDVDGRHLRADRARLRPRVLGVDGEVWAAVAVEAQLDDLPVALVTSGLQDPAVLRVVVVERPVLEPAPAAVRRLAAVDLRQRCDRPAERLDCDRQVALGAVEAVDGAPALERVGAGNRRQRRERQRQKGREAERQRPPAIAGRITIVSDSPTGVSRPSSTRTSSSFR